ncbi:DUF5132 domain-containing protein [Cohnella pontilimi]|uniref:DUF5132 domain-containing protein n=1 Tax=Cohnella pontilimi TaxID=2564100 RepID=A0A4V5LT30_9BACL|nr:DUF5132 domain-containing protein [Cohnella pontilimi]TJY44149.1 DUF5132 domain-containing protein [Cohnella pontilimi]
MERNVERLIVGAALGLAASTLLPILKPLASEGIQAFAGLAGRVKYAAQIIREEAEDIVAEAQFERMRKKLDREIMSEP